jgi:GNAT superfamily N-acetyltransferase
MMARTTGRAALPNSPAGTAGGAQMTEFSVRPLEPMTWPDFASLVERHGGVWGGCWCLGFHPEGKEPGPHRRDRKQCRVSEGSAHAALVYDGDVCVGWCQFGSPAELSRVKHQRAYLEGLAELPDWRITCFFVDKAYRGRGVSSVALGGALNEIARLGGGRVESYPEDVAGRKVSSSFLYNASASAFERHGFERVRRLGAHHWVVAKVVAPTAVGPRSVRQKLAP